MVPLYEFSPDVQMNLIEVRLGRYGKVVDRMKGAFGEIFVFRSDRYTHGGIVAKCPNIITFGSVGRAREALEKVLLELQHSFRYYRYTGVHRLFEIELVHGWPFLLSRLRDGTLADLICNPEKWTLSDKLMGLIQVAHALNYCRRLGLISHQDLKPANVFFDSAARKYRIEQPNYVGLTYEMAVADFGLADAFRDIGVNSGSRPYMAPEQYEKRELIDGSKIDVFALGVITFECLMGGLHPIGERTSDVWPNPVSGKPKKWLHEDVWKIWSRKIEKNVSLEQRAEGVSAQLEELIRISLTPDLAERPSMDEVEARLEAALRAIDPDRAAGLQMQLDYLDGFTSSESGWPHMEERLREMREFYARRGKE